MGGWADGWMNRETDGPADIDDGLDRLDQIENKLLSNVNMMQVRATPVAPFAQQAVLWCIYRVCTCLYPILSLT